MMNAPSDYSITLKSHGCVSSEIMVSEDVYLKILGLITSNANIEKVEIVWGGDA